MISGQSFKSYKKEMKKVARDLCYHSKDKEIFDKIDNAESRDEITTILRNARERMD